MEINQQSISPSSRQLDAPANNADLAALVKPMSVILALYLLAATAYLLVTPVFEKPDEPLHFAFSMYLARHNYQLPNLNSLPEDYFAGQEGTQAPLFYLLYAGILDVLDFDLEDGDYAFLSQSNPQQGWESPLWPDNPSEFTRGRCLTNTCESMILAVYVGRAINIFVGAMSVVAAAAAVKISFPKHTYLAVIVAVMIAFTPQFLHITSSVTNDILAILGINLSFALGLWWLKHPQSTRTVVALGGAVSIAALSKTSGLSIGVIAGLLLLFGNSFPWRSRIDTVFVFGVTVLAISGWWYIRNWLIYGDPAAIGIHLEFTQIASRDLTVQRFIAEWGGVLNSFYGAFGWGYIILPRAIYLFMRLQIIALALLFVVTSIRYVPRWTRPQRNFVLLSIVQIVIVSLLLFRWMRLTEAPLGRLLFPAILPIMLVFALGLVYSVPQNYRRRATRVWSAAIIATAFAIPVTVIYPAYRPVEPIYSIQENTDPIATFSEQDQPGNAEIYDIVWDVEDNWLYLQLAWRVQHEFAQNYQIFVHVRDERGQIITQRDSHAGLGNRPTTTWEAGDTFGDVYPIPLPSSTSEIVAIAIGLYASQNGTWQRLPADSADFPVDDNAVIIPIAEIRRNSRD